MLGNPRFEHAVWPGISRKIVLSEAALGGLGVKIVAVALPPEDYQPGDEDKCGLFQYNLYGTRGAAQNWEKLVTVSMKMGR